MNKYLYPKIIKSGNRTFARFAETTEAQRYKKKLIPLIKKQIKEQEWTIPEEGKRVNVYIDFYFNKKGMDPNNYLKILYDVMKVAGVYIDDDIAKPQTGLVVIDKYHPRLEIKIYESSQIGVFKDNEDRDRFIADYENTMQKRSFTALLKKLDQGRITLNVYHDDEKCLRMRED